MNGECQAAKVKLVQFCQRFETMTEFQQRKALSILRRCMTLMDQFLNLIDIRKSRT